MLIQLDIMAEVEQNTTYKDIVIIEDGIIK